MGAGELRGRVEMVQGPPTEENGGGGTETGVLSC